jgi:hypothetical protein
MRGRYGLRRRTLRAVPSPAIQTTYISPVDAETGTADD